MVAVPTLQRIELPSSATVEGRVWICWRRPGPGCQAPATEGRSTAVWIGRLEIRISLSSANMSVQVCLHISLASETMGRTCIQRRVFFCLRVWRI